jgi:hypothetical protein
MFTHNDKITHKTIAYEGDDIFILKIRIGYNRKRVIKVFEAPDIQKALDEFYSLQVMHNGYKYLSKHPKGKYHLDGELLLRMRGEIKTTTPETVRLAETYKVKEWKKGILANLISCPVSLIQKMKTLVDLDGGNNLPASSHRWNVARMIYCSVAYIAECSPEERNKILSIGLENFEKHKSLSGYDHELESKLRVDVVSLDNKDELL